MREIKFRQFLWSDDSKKNGGVMIGWEELLAEQVESLAACFTTEFSNASPLMQFTGLCDRNGKEIYEGDIVVQDGYMWFDDGTPNYRGTVEWIYSQWQVAAHCVNPDKRGISDGINEGLNDGGFDEGKNAEWEIIGNIHEHPHLLGAD